MERGGERAVTAERMARGWAGVVEGENKCRVAEGLKRRGEGREGGGGTRDGEGVTVAACQGGEGCERGGVVSAEGAEEDFGLGVI